MDTPPLSIPLYLSQSQDCDYLPGQKSQSAFIDPAKAVSADLYEHLLGLGFRRSGQLIYKPYCENCQQCVPCRLPMHSFKASRSQKRIIKLNSDLTTRVIPAKFNQEHFDLYLKYQNFRHLGGSMEKFDQTSYKDFICGSIEQQASFIETRLNDQLLAIAVTDIFKHANSAVYTFFEPEQQKRSLGTYSILKQIELSQQQQKHFLYLGYFIENCQKMSYKDNFKPLEIYQDESWSIKEPLIKS